MKILGPIKAFRESMHIKTQNNEIVASHKQEKRMENELLMTYY